MTSIWNSAAIRTLHSLKERAAAIFRQLSLHLTCDHSGLCDHCVTPQHRLSQSHGGGGLCYGVRSGAPPTARRVAARTRRTVPRKSMQHFTYFSCIEQHSPQIILRYTCKRQHNGAKRSLWIATDFRAMPNFCILPRLLEPTAVYSIAFGMESAGMESAGRKECCASSTR